MNEIGLKTKDDLKYEDYIEYEDDIKCEDELKYENDVNIRTTLNKPNRTKYSNPNLANQTKPSKPY